MVDRRADDMPTAAGSRSGSPLVSVMSAAAITSAASSNTSGVRPWGEEQTVGATALP